MDYTWETGKFTLGNCFYCTEVIEVEGQRKVYSDGSKSGYGPYFVEKPLICSKCRKGILGLIRPLKTRAAETGSKGLALHREICSNIELIELEMDGFARGEKRGKTMDVPLETVVDSLRKQNMDFQESYLRYLQTVSLIVAASPNMLTPENHNVKIKQLNDTHLENIKDLKRRIADIRNVAGCVFLKLSEGEKTQQ